MTPLSFNFEYITIAGHQCTILNEKILILARIGDSLVAPHFLGGKGYSLCVMVAAGLNVPNALIIPTSIGKEWLSPLPTFFKSQHDKVREILSDPFVIDFLNLSSGMCSVRSGAEASMAGMMDTILNVGAASPSVLGKFMETYPDEDFARDCTNRFIETYNSALTTHQATADAFTKAMMDLDIVDQYFKCVDNVFKSFNTDRAKLYRTMNGLTHIQSTACVIQRMVFGNMNENSCTGVAFSRNPTTGESKLTGEYLVKAQGEDVVSGKVTPLNLDEMWHWNKNIYKQLADQIKGLEEMYLDVLDIEFTVQDGELFFLQCRSAKRTASASIKLFKAMMESYKDVPLFTRLTEMVPKLDPNALDKMRVTEVEVSAGQHTHEGLGVCEGAVCGYACYSLADLQAAKNRPLRVFVALETTPKDLPCFALADAIITMRGGATSHAAVVARSMGIPCIVGAESMISAEAKEGYFTMCGRTGRIWDSYKAVVDKGSNELSEFIEYLAPLLGYTLVDEVHTVGSFLSQRKKDLKPHTFARFDINASTLYPNNPDIKAYKYLGGVEDLITHLSDTAANVGITHLDENMHTKGKSLRKVADLVDFATNEKRVDLTDAAKGKLSARDRELYDALYALRSKVHGVPVQVKEGTYISRSKFLRVLLSLKIQYG